MLKNLLVAFGFFVAVLMAPLSPATAQNAPSGKFLHLSDIHFDPFYNPAFNQAMFDALNKADADDWEKIFLSWGITTPETRTQFDSNYPLLTSALDRAMKPDGQTPAKYDYIILTGDYLRHEFLSTLSKYTQDPAVQRKFTAKTVKFVNLMIAKRFPKAPLIATVGNNDSVCGDYNLTPGGDILPAVGDDLPVIDSNAAAQRDFTAGGYYRTPHPTVPNVDFLVLSIFWSNNYYDICDNKQQNPAAVQLQWLTDQLSAAQKAGHRTILLMHIPPGIDAFSSRKHREESPRTLWTRDGGWLSSFNGVTSQYKAQLTGGFAGHTHMDEFRVLADTSPYLAIRMGPSVTTYNGNYPAFTVFTYDTKDGTALDYDVYALGRNGWGFEYNFGKTYGYKRYDPASLQALSKKILSGGNAKTSFGKYYASGNSTPANGPDWRYFACSLTNLTGTPYSACQRGTSAVKRTRN